MVSHYAGSVQDEPRCAICHERPANPDDGVLCDPCFIHYNNHGDEPCPDCPSTHTSAPEERNAESAREEDDEGDEDDGDEERDGPDVLRSPYFDPLTDTQGADDDDDRWGYCEECRQAPATTPVFGGMYEYCLPCAEATRPPTHTHPCPTCRVARPCTATGCADGERECTTCSNCRGW